MVAGTHFSEGFKRGLADFSENIGIFLNLFLLTLVYFLGVGLVFLIAKISGKRFLISGIDKKAKTYWEERSRASEDEDNFYRQF